MAYSVFGRSWDRIPGPIFTVPVSGSSDSDQIPVRFVNFDAPQHERRAASRNLDEISAAIRIQSAFRGFSVRKTKPLENLKIVAQVKAAMEEMRRRLNDPQFLELIRRHKKEHFKLTEGIMSLLLKLDEIQGVKCFVKEARRAVAHELVSLHESVDSMNHHQSTEKTDEVSKDPRTREHECCQFEREREGKEGTAGRCWFKFRMRKIMRRSYWK